MIRKSGNFELGHGNFRALFVYCLCQHKFWIVCPKLSWKNKSKIRWFFIFTAHNMGSKYELVVSLFKQDCSFELIWFACYLLSVTLLIDPCLDQVTKEQRKRVTDIAAQRLLQTNWIEWIHCRVHAANNRLQILWGKLQQNK